MPYGQLVVGPPGSGKSTYCHGMQQLLSSLNRNPVLVNLDPANENIPYECSVNIKDLISIEQAMDEQGLGPNGALLYCMEELERNISWLEDRLKIFEDGYFIIDLPGQVEVSTCHESLLIIIRRLLKHNFRLTVVHLADAAYCLDPSKYISMLVVTIKSMMQLECPQVNVLSKVDLIGSYGLLPLPLECYTKVQGLHYLLETIKGNQIGSKYHRLNEALCELVEDSTFLSFIPLAVEDKDCMTFLLGEIDKSNGFIFGGLTIGNESIMKVSMTQSHQEQILELVHERYIVTPPNRTILFDDQPSSFD